MDGYAVRSQDTIGASSSNPVKLMIAGRLFPSDHPSTSRIGKGQCVYTSTGAPLPEGSDAVIQVERTRLAEGAIEIVHAVPAKENVCARGEEIKQGEILLKRGDVVSPQGMGMLLTLGIRNVEVVKRPRVHIISVGDELAETREEAQDRVVNDHAYIVSELLHQIGAEPNILGVVPDDPKQIQAKISDALQDADLVITIAGSSVGAKDFVPDVVESLGKTVFHGVAITPGKVTGLGVAHRKPVVMLPGYLMSALAGFHLFVVPILNRIVGHDSGRGVAVVVAKLKKAVRSKHGFERFQFLQLTKQAGSYLATPIDGQMGGTRNLSKANGYTIIPKDGFLREGKTIPVTLFVPSEFQRIEVES
jgi:molybdopterin molybdotransferase